ncbi:MAG: two-component system, OmpR family, response regulator [Thermomicrobiales bacterium]|nr:two-component system, OmpR family, response regulator [Thermomicrobiales bacterium]MEA2583135.1 two-component system, OmpR family, response regulator [Thermomicrobiales bacterium]MEA2597331.1 two-component system, OmpR family, response regulator [Thermomicrobiales bacterium]
MRILVVEDEPRLAALLQRGLTEEGHAVDVVETGEEALDWAEFACPDAIILDVMLPGIDGLEVCRRLRDRRIQVPILLLTVRHTVTDRVAGLDAGADDYLVKPFAFAELTARLRALARRPAETLETTLQAGDVRLDPATRRVWRGEREVMLSNKEFRILECLIRRPNYVLTRQMISDQVWNYDARDTTNLIEVHIRSLRQKLDDPYPGALIQTVRGAGYRFVA